MEPPRVGADEEAAKQKLDRGTVSAGAAEMSAGAVEVATGAVEMTTGAVETTAVARANQIS